MLSTAHQLKQSLAEVAQLAERNALLSEENRWLKQQLFGRSSEKRPTEISAEQTCLFNEAEAAAETPVAPEAVMVPAHARKKAGRQPISPELPRVEVVHDLPEAEKVCPDDGAPLVRIGEETSEQYDYVPAKVQVIRHVRLKYACPCCRRRVKLAGKPVQILPKSLASPSLLAQITTAKYVDGLPLHRQEAQFARLGIHLPRATMANWMIALGADRVVPIINLLNDAMLEAPLIHCDETRVQVLRSDKAVTADHWMWVRASGPPEQKVLLFDYDPSRAGHVPRRLLEGFKGILLTDGYEAYNGVAQAHGLVHAGCMAHARRYFEDARKVQVGSNPAGSRACVALDYIGQLYRIERTLRDRPDAPSPHEWLDVRRRRSAPIMAAFKAWLDNIAPQVLPQSALGKAIYYALSQWQKLSVFLTDAVVPLDNNRSENALRPFVVGRKSWLFCDTPAGATASANLYSLVTTAKANGVEPHAYLTHLYTHLPSASTIEDFETLLPWNLAPPLS